MQHNLSQSHKQPIGVYHQKGEGGSVNGGSILIGGKITGPVGPIDNPGVFHIPQAGDWMKKNGGSIGTGGKLGGIKPKPISDPIDPNSPHLEKIGNSFKIPDNPVDAYHYLLNMSPQQLELKREIASQMLGGVPSKMWGKLIDDGDKMLKADAEHYESVIRMPNSHAMARELEAQHSYGDSGAGFMDTLKHLGHVASKAYKTGRIVGKFLYANRTPLLKGLGLQEYSSQIDEFANRVKNFDEVLNPLADQGLKLKDKKEAVNTAATVTDKIPSMSQQAPLSTPYYPYGR